MLRSGIRIFQFFRHLFCSSPWRLALLAFLLTLPLLLLSDLPERDLAGRYGPMADAFAAGDWSYAFHPRIPPLFPVTAGIIAWITGWGGFWAAKLASALFFSLSVFPLYGIFCQVFQPRLATWGCLLYVFSSHLLRLAVLGVRDTAKGFAFFLAIYGLLVLYRERHAWRGYIWCALGCGLLILVRSDCVLYAAAILLAVGGMELFALRKFPWRWVMTVILMLLIIQPWLFYNYQKLGYWVPDVRFGMIADKVESLFRDQAKTVSLTQPDSSAAMTSNQGLFFPPETSHHGLEIKKFLLALGKGFYPYFGLLALIVVLIRVRHREWTRPETILLLALLGHAVLLLLQIFIFDRYLYVSRRYLLPIAPLAFGWTAWGLMQVWQKIRQEKPVWCLPAIAGAFLLLTILYLDAAAPMLKNFTSDKKIVERRVSLAAAAWIRNDYRGPKQLTSRTFAGFYYFSARLPLVCSDELHVVGYLCGGQITSDNDPDIATGRLWPDYLILSSNTTRMNKLLEYYSPVKELSCLDKTFVIWRVKSWRHE